MQVYEYIRSEARAGRKLLAVLLDPEKECDLMHVAKLTVSADVKIVLVGGSGYKKPVDEYVVRLRTCFEQAGGGKGNPYIVLFPGDVSQVSRHADALLFLSLLSSRDAELLIGQHVRAAEKVKESGIETIAMGYILVDGGRVSTVERVTGSRALRDTREITATAMAGEMSGKRLIYLEAGSGAEKPVQSDIIKTVRCCTSVPLIVGGGIKTVGQMNEAFSAGADMVVIGNHFEEMPEDIVKFAREANKL